MKVVLIQFVCVGGYASLENQSSEGKDIHVKLAGKSIMSGKHAHQARLQSKINRLSYSRQVTDNNYHHCEKQLLLLDNPRHVPCAGKMLPGHLFYKFLDPSAQQTHENLSLQPNSNYQAKQK